MFMSHLFGLFGQTKSFGVPGPSIACKIPDRLSHVSSIFCSGTKEKERSINIDNVSTWDILLVEDPSSEQIFHVGLVYFGENQEKLVVDSSPAHGKVSSRSFETFISDYKYYRIFALKPKSFFKSQLINHEFELHNLIKTKFLNHPYNYSFLQNQFTSLVTSTGKVILQRNYYCSELIREIFNNFLDENDDILPLKPMTFNSEFSKKMFDFFKFKHNMSLPPVGALGVAPEDFATFNFDFIGQLEESSF